MLGGATATPKIDEDRQGDPYAAGELLVSYEPGDSRRALEDIRTAGAAIA